MAIGRYVSDLDTGDVFEPVTFVITPEVSRRFCHGFEENSDWFHGVGMSSRQYAPPTLIHTAKMRLLKMNCPDGDGPYPRLITEYDANHHRPIPVGEPVVVSGQIAERYEKRGRQYLRTVIELRLESDGEQLITYQDQMLLRFQLEGSNP